MDGKWRMPTIEEVTQYRKRSDEKRMLWSRSKGEVVVGLDVECRKVSTSHSVVDLDLDRSLSAIAVKDIPGGMLSWSGFKDRVNYAEAQKWIEELNAPNEIETLEYLAKKHGYVLVPESEYEDWSLDPDLR